MFGYFQAYSRRAACLREMAEWEECVRDLEKVKELDPENSGFYRFKIL